MLCTYWNENAYYLSYLTLDTTAISLETSLCVWPAVHVLLVWQTHPSAKLLAHVALRTTCPCPSSEPHPSILFANQCLYQNLASFWNNQCALKARGFMRKVLGLELMVVNLTMMTLSGGILCGAKRPCLRIRQCVLHDVTFCILYLNRKRAAEEGLIFAFC